MSSHAIMSSWRLVGLFHADHINPSAFAQAGNPRNRSYNANISSIAIDFDFKPLMQRCQHANFIFATFSPVRRKEKRIEFPL